MSLDVTTRVDREGAKTIHVKGRLDTHTYRSLDEHLAREVTPADTTLVLDLAGLDYISSAGIRSVFALRKQLAGRGGRVLVVNVQPQVRKVFEIVKAVPVKEIFTSVAELDAYLDQIQRKALGGDDDDEGY